MTRPAVLARLPAAALDKHLAFLATSDAGKTYGAKGEVEQLLGQGRRVCIIDPTGVWWGLRLLADGETASPFALPIFAGLGPRDHLPAHVDVPVPASAGARLAELVGRGDFSCIVDVSAMSGAGRTQFLADFAETLSQVSRRPLHLVIDEAHLMMPQTIMGGDLQAARMVGAANHLVSGGRSHGLRIMLLTQRPAKLHNDSLTQVQTVVAMFNFAPADIRPVKNWVAINADPAKARELVASLPTLPVGEGWVYAPRLALLGRIHFGPITTFDSSAAPKDEDLVRAAVRLGELDLEQIRSELGAGASVAPAGAFQAVDQARLDAAREAGVAEGVERGRELERRSLEKSIATHPEVQRMLSLADRNGRAAGVEEFALRLFSDATKYVAGLRPRVPPEELRRRARDAAVRVGGGEAPAPALVTPVPEPPAPLPVPAPATTPPPAEPAPAEGASPDVELSEASVALINAARSAHRPVTWAEAAVLAGRIPQGGSFEAARRKLLDAGWREPCPNDRAGDRDMAFSHEEIIAALEPKVAAGKKASAHAPRGFRVLAERGRANREELAAILGVQPRGGHFEHLWRTLRRSPLIQELEDGRLDVIPVLQELRRIAEGED